MGETGYGLQAGEEWRSQFFSGRSLLPAARPPIPFDEITDSK